MERRPMRCFRSPTSGCIRPSATDAIASSSRPLLELRNQPVDAALERLHVAFGEIAAEGRAPGLVCGRHLLDQRLAAACQLNARAAQVLRICGPLDQAELN